MSYIYMKEALGDYTKIKIHVRLAREQTYEEHQIRLELKITLH